MSQLDVATVTADLRKVEENTRLVIGALGPGIAVTTVEESVRFLLISGKPIGEPVAWYGPIVMNTDEELQEAFEEYRNGTFIKHKKSSGT